MNANLGQIKQYCIENGINIEAKQNIKPATINGNQMYGDNLAQAYLEYYLMNKDDIDASGFAGF